jgi:hypothetical protein
MQARHLQRAVNIEPRRFREVISGMRDQEELDVDEETQPSGQKKKFLVLTEEGVKDVDEVSGGSK